MSFLLLGYFFFLFVPQYAPILAFLALRFGFGRWPSLAAFAFAAGVRTPSNRIELVRKTHHKNPFTVDQKIGRQHEDSLEKTSIGKTLGKVKSSSIGPAWFTPWFFVQPSYAKKRFERFQPFYLHRARKQRKFVQKWVKKLTSAAILNSLSPALRKKSASIDKVFDFWWYR